MLENRLSNFDNNERRVILVGAAVLCWAIWRCRNDIIFNKTKYSSFMQAVFRGTYWLRLWEQLQHKDAIKMMFRRASLALEVIAVEIANHGWKHNLRIGLDHFPFVHSPASQWAAIFCNNHWAVYFAEAGIRFHYLKKCTNDKFLADPVPQTSCFGN